MWDNNLGYYTDQSRIPCEAGNVLNASIQTGQKLLCIFTIGDSNSSTFGKNPKISISGFNLTQNPTNFEIYLANIKNPATASTYADFIVNAYSSQTKFVAS